MWKFAAEVTSTRTQGNLRPNEGVVSNAFKRMICFSTVRQSTSLEKPLCIRTITRLPFTSLHLLHRETALLIILPLFFISKLRCNTGETSFFTSTCVPSRSNRPAIYIYFLFISFKIASTILVVIRDRDWRNIYQEYFQKVSVKYSKKNCELK